LLLSLKTNTSAFFSFFAQTDEERERLGKLTFGDKARRGARHDADRLTLIGPGPKPLNGFRHGEQPSFPFSSVFANRLQKKGTRDVSTKKLRNESGPIAQYAQPPRKEDACPYAEPARQAAASGAGN
jgi:hypothetical protein